MKRIVVFVSLLVCVFAADMTANEKRSAIVEADGYTQYSGDKSVPQMRREALLSARRNALEKARTSMQSYTLVQNHQLIRDVVITSSAGEVYVLEQQDLGVTSDRQYHCRIKAEVTYALSDAQTDRMSELQAAPLTVTFKTDKAVYQQGEKIYLLIQGNKDFYASIVYKNAEGQLLQVLPNGFRKERFFKGGEQIRFPDAEDRFELMAGPPYGDEQFILYASSAELGIGQHIKSDQSIYQLTQPLDEYSQDVRNVYLGVDHSTGKYSTAEFFETEVRIQTRE